MKIVVNTQLLLKDRLEGLGWFTYETLMRITRKHPQHEFYFVFDRAYDPSFIFADNVKPVILRPPSRHPLLWYLRFEWLLPLLLKKLKADVYLAPDGWSTLNTKIPCVQVIHDINFEHYPKDVPLWTGKYFRYFFPRYAKKAHVVATVSDYSKNDIVKTYGIEESKIHVLHNGCNTSFKTMPDDVNSATRQKFSDNCPYFLYVGALLPRKNIARLFKAFDIFKATDNEQTKLLIVGEKKWWTKEIEQAYESMQFKESVSFLGRQNVKELNALYAAALALTFVPYFEGFGIPILEAFNCGTAVITSNCTSMPEVAGDAAYLVDPYDIHAIAIAMTEIATQESLRQELIAKGHKRKTLFSWDNTADKLWDCIEKATPRNT